MTKKLSVNFPIPETVRIEIQGGGRVIIHAKLDTPFTETGRIRSTLEKEYKHVKVSWGSELPA